MSGFNNLLDIQRNMASRLNQEMRMNQTLQLLELIQQLKTDKFGRIQKEAVLVEAHYEGISEEEVLSLLKELVRNGTLKETEEYLSF